MSGLEIAIFLSVIAIITLKCSKGPVSKLELLKRISDYRKLGENSPMEIRTEGGNIKINRLEV